MLKASVRPVQCVSQHDTDSLAGRWLQAHVSNSAGSSSSEHREGKETDAAFFEYPLARFSHMDGLITRRKSGRNATLRVSNTTHGVIGRVHGHDVILELPGRCPDYDPKGSLKGSNIVESREFCSFLYLHVTRREYVNCTRDSHQTKPVAESNADFVAEVHGEIRWF